MTRDFVIQFQAAIETFVRREATREEVPQGAVWDALNVSLTANKLLHQLPRLLAQASLPHQHRREEIEREQRRQQVLRNYEENNWQ